MPSPSNFHGGVAIRLVALILTALGVGSLLAGEAPATRTSSLAATPPARERFHVYLLMGQSNMVGRDTRAIDLQPRNARILTLDGEGLWAVAQDPLHPRVGRIDPGVGPGISFAAAMLKANPDITIGLVPCAVGGTPLRRWMKGADLYEQAVARARLAAKAGTIKGVLWHQGESDSDKKANAESYQARLTQMLKDLRQDLGQPGLPIVVGQLGEFLPVEKHPFVDTVRSAIRHMPEALPAVGYADSAGLQDKGDKLHFSADAARELGTRYAQAMRQIQQQVQ